MNGYLRYDLQSQFNETSDAMDGDYRFKASSVGVSISMPVFDGYRRKNRIRATQVQLYQLELESMQLQDQTAMELVKATETFTTTESGCSLRRRTSSSPTRCSTTRKALYAEGVTTLIELLDAERELSQARTNYKQAFINVQSGILDVHKANGTLLTQYLTAL